MKTITILILNLCILINVTFSQENSHLPSLSKDTIAIASELSCWLQNLKNSELINTAHSEIFDKIIGHPDSSIYLYSGNAIPFKKEFSIDGCDLSVFVFPNTINKTSNCSWIEIKEIRLKKHRILLLLILHKKTSSETTISILYKFKITDHHKYGTQYKLIKKCALH